MPMIMDHDLDELFGDAPIQIARALPKGLLQRVDDLHVSGCRQRIAWSRLGCIAYISSDGFGVCSRQLFCKPADGRWSLSDEVPINGVPEVHAGSPLVHISFNQQGNELAIFDSLGKISIVTITFTLNEFTIPRKCVVDAEDHLNGVVGLLWLNTDKPHSFHPPAYKKGGQWNFSPQQLKTLGPHNPAAGMSALVTITKGAIIRIMFQGQDRTWHQSRAEIDKVTSPHQLFIHATLCAHQDSTMLLAAHTSDQQLILYRITFNFQRLAFDIQHLKTLGDCFPKDLAHDNLQSGQSHTNAQLTHLEYFPQGPENREGKPSRPFVLASFTDVAEQDSDQVSHEPHSIVCRWELHSVKPQLHPNFEQLSKKSNPSAPNLPTEVAVKRLPDTFIPKVFLYIQQVRVSTLIAIAFSDGSIEIRDRLTMERVAQDNVLEKVSGLGQIGFEFPQDGYQLHTALSPNACAVVSFADTTDIQLRLIQLPLAEGVETLDSSFCEAATEAFTLHFSTACTSYGNYQDDLLAAIQVFSEQHSHSNIEQGFLNEIYRILDVRLDHSVESQLDYLFKSPMVQRCLGVQLSLGCSSERKPRPLPAKIAQAFLDIRSTTLIMTYALKSNAAAANPDNDTRIQQETDARKAEELLSLQGHVSWIISLMGFIVDELFQLGDLMRDHGSMDTEHLRNHIQTSNNPSLPLILISASRTFLRYLCRYLRQFALDAQQGPKTYSPHATSFTVIAPLLRESPVQYHLFDKLLADFDSSIKNAYQASGISAEERKGVEKEMLVKGAVPDVLESALTTLLANGIDALREEINVAELYFTDFSWLELGDDPKARAWRREKRVDVVRKTVIMKGQAKKLKRCTRCCAVMEDVGVSGGARRNGGILQLQRFCLCGGWWMAVDGGGEFAVGGGRG